MNITIIKNVNTLTSWSRPGYCALHLASSNHPSYKGPGLPPYQEPIRRATSPYPFVNEGNFEERNSGSTDLTGTEDIEIKRQQTTRLLDQFRITDLSLVSRLGTIPGPDRCQRYVIINYTRNRNRE
ncbi:unnamed protein product [Aspergillus oryzae]|nr:unnamed protein product [Aspergillus oryzae]GMF94830.1 unnamed protein product [Aspergillus oryzae]